jgi:hypothetical protein
VSINIAANFGAKALIAADSYCLREDVTPPVCSKVLFASYPQALVTGRGLNNLLEVAASAIAQAGLPFDALLQRLPEIIIDACARFAALAPAKTWPHGAKNLDVIVGGWSKAHRRAVVRVYQLSDFKDSELECTVIGPGRAWFSPMPDGGLQDRDLTNPDEISAVARSLRDEAVRLARSARLDRWAAAGGGPFDGAWITEHGIDFRRFCDLDAGDQASDFTPPSNPSRVETGEAA